MHREDGPLLSLDEQRDRRAQSQVFHFIHWLYVRVMHPQHGRHCATHVCSSQAPEDESTAAEAEVERERRAMISSERVL